MSGELKAFLMSLLLLAGAGWYLATTLPREWNHARTACAESTVDGCYTERPGRVVDVGHEDDRWPVRVVVPGEDPLVLRLHAEPPLAGGDGVTVRFVGGDPAGLVAGGEYFDARPSSRMVPIALACVVALLGFAGAFGTAVTMLGARRRAA